MFVKVIKIIFLICLIVVGTHCVVNLIIRAVMAIIILINEMISRYYSLDQSYSSLNPNVHDNYGSNNNV